MPAVRLPAESGSGSCPSPHDGYALRCRARTRRGDRLAVESALGRNRGPRIAIQPCGLASRSLPARGPRPLMDPERRSQPSERPHGRYVRTCRNRADCQAWQASRRGRCRHCDSGRPMAETSATSATDWITVYLKTGDPFGAVCQARSSMSAWQPDGARSRQPAVGRLGNRSQPNAVPRPRLGAALDGGGGARFESQCLMGCA